MSSSGEEKAWEILKGLDPEDVCKNASVLYDEKSGHYVLKSFCTDFQINFHEKIIKSSDHSGEVILNRYGYFFVHSCLWYLVHAKDIPFTGRLCNPVSLQGGDVFFRGSHVLPLDNLAKVYGADKKTFIKKGEKLCAAMMNYGDASVKLFPLPRIPVILVLWIEDEEFPSRADLLLDSSCEMHLPLDIIWSIAMLSVLVMI
jgi:Domain of unknown function (DUF3786)